MERIQQVLETANRISQSEEFEELLINAQDFISEHGSEGSNVTKISQTVTSLSEAAQVLNRSFAKEDSSGATVNIISPVVMPKSHRSWGWVFITLLLLVLPIAALVLQGLFPGFYGAVFGIHYWLLVVGYVGFHVWRNSYVEVPDGCEALITKFGKVEETVGAGRKTIFHPWKRVSYIVNVVKEYPYNAPIREAPTLEQVNASVDLFLQFRIRDPQEFIFTLGGVNGFSEKLQNAISEQTRALIYAQRAEDIYDLVGESTSDLLVSLNNQFSPAVEFVNANITHAEPSSQDYRMDLAAAEMVRVAKKAYTYEYELDLRKKRDEGDLDKELAGLRETLSEINADIATFEAQMTTAHEKEINRANAYAQQLMIEAESEAHANAALFEAQALDIRAVKTAHFPEILEYRYQQQVLERINDASSKLPQVINMGQDGHDEIDFMALSRKMLGVGDKPLYTLEDLANIRANLEVIAARIKEREAKLQEISTETDNLTPVEEVLES